MNQDTVSFLSLGGVENVTRNMYLYEYKNQILIVDCGLGFPDETMLGVDLLLPDISYLLDNIRSGRKKIIGMVLTHGHEDHIGGLPFILPQFMPDGSQDLPFPVYASPLTAALSNEKLAEFNLPRSVQIVNFTEPEVKIGEFSVTFIHVTHSVPDSANFIINTPVGNFFHGSDFKFDLSPYDGKRTEFLKITKAAQEGILCLMSDCLGAERPGNTPSEYMLGLNFEREMRECHGKVLVTTYSSNIARLNQVIQAAEKVGRKVCFVGRSVIKVKQIAEHLGYLHMRNGTEVPLLEIQKYKGSQAVLVVAGSQGQENSAMTRIAEGEHKEIQLDPLDTVIFSSDPIPGNEVAINSLVDTISKIGARVVLSSPQGLFHVSGHGSSGDHQLLVALTQPKYLLPISGTFRSMIAYKNLVQKMGYSRKDIYLIENGQEILFTQDSAKYGNKIEVKHVYVDEVSGEEVDNFVVRDRERLAREGVIIIMVEIKASDGQLADRPEILARGSSLTDLKNISVSLSERIEKQLAMRKQRVNNWVSIRRLIGQTAERYLSRKFRTSPLVLPVVIEV